MPECIKCKNYPCSCQNNQQEQPRSFVICQNCKSEIPCDKCNKEINNREKIEAPTSPTLNLSQQLKIITMKNRPFFEQMTIKKLHQTLISAAESGKLFVEFTYDPNICQWKIVNKWILENGLKILSIETCQSSVTIKITWDI